MGHSSWWGWLVSCSTSLSLLLYGHTAREEEYTEIKTIISNEIKTICSNEIKTIFIHSIADSDADSDTDSYSLTFIDKLDHQAFAILCILKTFFEQHMSIPDICHFFTWAKFLENKIYTEKTRKLRQNTQ